MLDFPRWKVWSITLGLALMVLLAVPSLVPEKVRNSWPHWVPKPAVNLGLDLAGGSYLLLEADTSDVQQSKLEQMRDQVRVAMRRDPRVDIGDISISGGKLSFMVRDPSKVDAAREKLLPMTNGVGTTGQRDWEIAVRDSTRFVLTPTQAGLAQQIETAMNDAREVVDKRINALGTREPTVVREGSNRIVVQVPGLQDPSRLKEILGKTAKMDFRMVDSSVSPEVAAQGRVPPESEVLMSQQSPKVPYVVKKQVLVSGGDLTDAQAGFDQRSGEPIVTFRFNTSGARKFAQATSENVGQPFAIILDNEVISAPVIREPITGGSGQISGNFTVQQANDLAILLRAGALPAPLTIIEERTVGPGLGQDSIAAGELASYVGSILVIVFMTLTYRLFGLFANIAVAINVAMIFGLLSLLNATLTLPGIAGIVLTVGIAVDSNVLIYERIREEVRGGRNAISAIDAGFSRALATIMDSNITTFIAAAVLFYIGTGPVRGFAVTLGIGIVTTVFTAFTVTRLIVAGWVRWKRPQTVPI
jgi:preprotein translocase subunit SecD